MKNNNEPLRNHKLGWNADRNEKLMRLLFNGIPKEGLRKLAEIVGTTGKGIDRQWLKIAQRYTDYGRRSYRLVETDLKQSRAGLPWTYEDNWVVYISCDKVGREHKADNPTHIAKILGRSKAEVQKRLKSIIGIRSGFGFQSDSETIHRNLADKVAGISKHMKVVTDSLTKESLEHGR